mmetsp:Transcript_33693/g.107402  ORF Transcript_33693/g.107402 Transcript_33693/m.107402 type:complete len:211 (+) Transcript_33693:504-1136(+)
MGWCCGGRRAAPHGMGVGGRSSLHTGSLCSLVGALPVADPALPGSGVDVSGRLRGRRLRHAAPLRSHGRPHCTRESRVHGLLGCAARGMLGGRDYQLHVPHRGHPVQRRHAGCRTPLPPRLAPAASATNDPCTAPLLHLAGVPALLLLLPAPPPAPPQPRLRHTRRTPRLPALLRRTARYRRGARAAYRPGACGGGAGAAAGTRSAPVRA